MNPIIRLNQTLDACLEFARGHMAARSLMGLDDLGKAYMYRPKLTTAILQKNGKAAARLTGNHGATKEATDEFLKINRDKIAKELRNARKKLPVAPGFSHEGTFIYNPSGDGHN